MNCPQCGHEPPTGSAFCNGCGAELEIVCARCGATPPLGSKFCNRARYRIVDRAALADALGVKLADLASVHRDWIETALRNGKLERDGRWTESVAVGSRGYVEHVRRELGSRGRYRVIEPLGDSHILHETAEDYGYDSRCEIAGLSRESTPL